MDWVEVFIHKSYKDIILDSLRYCQKEKGLVVSAYVIMTSRMHLVVEAGGSIPLSDILRDFKKFTAGNSWHFLFARHTLKKYVRLCKVSVIVIPQGILLFARILKYIL